MPKTIKILSIESSADETSAAVLEGDKKSKQFRLLANIIYSQIKIHQKTGGIVPEVAARNHILKILPVIRHALAKAGVKLKEVNAIAVTAGPGLITSLMIGVDTAKALTFALNKPIIPINHHEGHLLSALGNFPPPNLPHKGGGNTKIFPSLPARPAGGDGRGEGRVKFPALGLIVSGGHTMLVLVEKIGRYKILGETLDDAAGECFDKAAKILGLPYPGGPEISKLARKGNPKAIDFPRPMMDKKNYNFSFSGLKTALLYYVRDHKTISHKLQADIAASLEQTIIDVLVAKTIRAAKEFRVKTILLGGGVSANRKLRVTLQKQIKKNLLTRLPDGQATYYLQPTTGLTTDNAGMIAIAAWYQYLAGKTSTFDKVKTDPNLKLKNWQ